MKRGMTSDRHLDPLSKFCRLWICPMLSACVIFFVAVEPEPSQDILSRNKSLYIRNKTLPDFVRPGYEYVKYGANILFYLRPSQPYSASFYLSLEVNGLLFIINVKPSYGSHIAASGKQEPSAHHILGTEFQQTAQRLELPGRVSPGCFSLLPTENLSTSTHCLLVISIFIFSRYKLTAAFAREARQPNWKSKEAEKVQHAMLPSFVILSLTALGISTVIGFCTNSFIIAVNGMDRAKGRNINPRELILFTLGLFNIAYQFSMAANDSVLYLWSDLYFSDNVYTIFSILLLFTIFSSFWFTFCLCGFYYIMLVTFDQKFFMRLKQSISEVVPWMLLSSVLLSIIISVPVAWNIKKEDDLGQLDGNVTYNSTIQYSTPHMSLQYLLVTSIIGCCIPLILVAIANVLIVKSLCVHANHLGKSTGGMSVQSVEASVSAAHTVTSLLLLYISFYVSQILLIMAVFDVDSLWFSVCLVVIYAYSPVQSIILILGSPKLKSTLVRFLGSYICRTINPPSEKVRVIS